MNDLISIIVPVYNTENYLYRCVDSVLDQTYKNIEVILVDDGSTDSSPQICDEYAKKDKRVVVVHKQNGGLSSARNAGLDIAKGEYIGFVDSDDFIEPYMYEDLISAIKDNLNTIGNVMYVRSYESGDISPSVVPHNFDQDISSEKYFEELLLHVGDVSVCTKLFPKNIIGNLRFPDGILNEDLIFMVQIITKIKTVKFVGQVGYYYFVREKSISSGYGKAIIDMQINSLWVLNYVVKKYPKLQKQAMRFALYQNMAYLLVIPSKAATKNNKIFHDALAFVRNNALKNVCNPYLRAKEKVILLTLGIMPKQTAKIFQNKRR